MPQIERYLFRQLRGPTLWAIAALGGVGILSTSLSHLDLIIDQRQSAWVYLKVTLLAVPGMISLIVPLGTFVAALLTLNRLHTEQEVVVCYAGGVSPWRVASPAMRLAVWLSLITLGINLWVAPMASRNMHDEITRARADLAATLVQAGQFTQPSPGLTVYAQSVDRGGLMHNLFIYQETQNARPTTYTAAEGRLAKQDGAPVILMHNATSQTLSDDGKLSYLTFEDSPFDLPMQVQANTSNTKASDRYMSELLHPAKDDDWGRKNRKPMKAEFHSRIAGPLYNLAFMAFAISAILGGGFSRMGYTRRVAALSAVAITTRILGFVVQEAAGHTPALNILQYLIPLAGLAFALGPYVYGPHFRIPWPAKAATAGAA